MARCARSLDAPYFWYTRLSRSKKTPAATVQHFRVTGFTRTSTHLFCDRRNANPDQHTDLQPIHVPEVPRHRAMLTGLLINAAAS